MLGITEVKREGRWQSINVGETLKAGDVVRTGQGSRVAIHLASGSQLKLNANSQLELKQIAPPPQGWTPTSTRLLQSVLRVLSGEIWVRNNGEPLEIQTFPATATIRGTEFDIAIGPSDTARLAVLEGLVEFTNPQGTVLVAANEQATATVGEAPHKAVLLNPLDAVQWSLYYPGIVSYRDYPLSNIESSRLQAQRAALQSRVAASPQDASAFVELGEINFDLGQRADAHAAFTQALTLQPRNPRAHTGLGWVYLETSDVAAALDEFRQAQPPVLMSLVGMANALYQLGRLDEANAVIAEAKKRFPQSPRPWTQAALNNLIQGRVAEARQALDQARALDPHDALANGLRSNIALVQNQKAQALEAAQQAIAANPLSPSAYLDLSLVKQAEFQLETALEAARKAVVLDPENPRALIQESRLLFGLGRTKDALRVAEHARRRAPHDALVNSTWGFLQLARGRANEAAEAFQAAIAQDSTLAEPHLGLGLVLFQRNKTDDAVEEMRKATLLEPKASLNQSYLGKAFYETKQNRLAQKYLALAKQLDPHDPTPHFYDAIRLQSVNQPVEAVQELQKSIELNDDRAVYRSRQLLDEDLAARAATLGQIYNEVGFTQLGLNEGMKSLANDPTNYSAHRLLADSYSAAPAMYEFAQVSELLQSQLLQPINIIPIQPQLAVTKLLIPAGLGPTTPSLYEFNPLFVQDRSTLSASTIFGTENTLGDNVLVSGLTDRFSYSIGQFHYQTDGFNPINNLRDDIYNFYTSCGNARF
ncbi:MAG: tetratricopeptide repeat protein [Candidatus Competibacteraceae bacterium]